MMALKQQLEELKMGCAQLVVKVLMKELAL